MPKQMETLSAGDVFYFIRWCEYIKAIVVATAKDNGLTIVTYKYENPQKSVWYYDARPMINIRASFGRGIFLSVPNTDPLTGEKR